MHRNLLKLVNELRPPEDSVVSPGKNSSTNSAQSRPRSPSKPSSARSKPKSKARVPKKSLVDPPSLHVPSLDSSDVTGAVSQGVANDLHAELDSSDSDDDCYAVEYRRRPPTVHFAPPVVDEAQPPARAEVQVEAEDEAVDVEVEEPLPVDDRGEIEEDEEGVGVGVEVSGSEEEIEEMLPEMVVETDLDDVLDRHSLSTVEEDDASNETLLDQSGDTVYETDSGEVVMDHEAEEYDTAAGSSSSDAEHDSSYDSASTSPVLPRPSNTVRRSERLAASAPPPVQSPPHRQLRVTPTASRASRRAAAATARAAAAARAATAARATTAATASSAATNASRRSTRTIIPRTIYSYDTIGGEPSHVTPSSGPEDQS